MQDSDDLIELILQGSEILPTDIIEDKKVSRICKRLYPRMVLYFYPFDPMYITSHDILTVYRRKDVHDRVNF